MIEPLTIVLNKAGCSGRAVRVRELEATQVEEAADIAAKQTDAETTSMKMQQLEIREGLRRWIVGVSKKGSLTEADVEKLTDDDFITLNLSILSQAGEKSYEALFPSARDHAILARAYKKIHGSNEAEVEDILGKARAVSSV